MIDDDVAAQVGLLLVPLHKQLIGPPEQPPVDVLGGFALVVQAVLGKLNRKTVKRAFMQARDEPFHHLAGNEFQVGEFLELVMVDVFQ
jgi:hypothetical protein